MKTLTQSHNQGSMQIFNESIIPYLNVMFYWGINPVRSRSTVFDSSEVTLIISGASDWSRDPHQPSDWPVMTTGPRPPGANTDRDEELLMLPPCPAISNRLRGINH